ncbi:MAG: 4-hydroxy-3-methylbut-2-enyl diphosphate reductase [Clostridia bacterium]|nr:4-hydroxy-3-methylbut-2-enyl diphosphate reductase [Clostridia bacterium]
MKIIVSDKSGFCFGVKNAVDTAIERAGSNTCTFGQLIHNESVIERLKAKGVRVVNDVSEITEKDTVIIRSHGVTALTEQKLRETGAEIVDRTCPFVAKIHSIVKEYSAKGYKIIILGTPSHPEVVGIAGRCEGEVVIWDGADEFESLKSLHPDEKVCFVEQTTFSVPLYNIFLKKIQNIQLKTVEIFDTICYTTVGRQKEAEKLASECDKVLVIGSKNSSNTAKLFSVSKAINPKTYYVSSLCDLERINFSTKDAIGIIAGASVPEESIMEVKKYMENFEAKVTEDFAKAVEESFVDYKPGKRIKGTVVSADDNGILVNIGGKKDGLVRKDDVNLDGSYDPAQFAEGDKIEVKIVTANDPDSGCVILSKKAVDAIKEADKIVETIRNGETFTIKIEKEVKGGLLSKLGTYTVFMPASQVKERFVKDLKPFVGKEFVVSALEIDDGKHKIVVSHRKVVEEERKVKEEIFWANVVPNVVVSGVVKRITPFGAFVSVDGFDCLAHIVDLSWTHIKTVDEVLEVGKNYEFLVLSADREKNKVSLGYKQLQPHPFVACMEKHPVGSKLTGKIVSVVPFGVFVEVEPKIEGLVHVSEVSRTFVKDINEVAKVGDEVEVMVMSYDEANRKINLSIKACLPEEVKPVEEVTENAEEPAKKVKKVRAKKNDENEESKEWSEDTANNPFADLLKDIQF